MALLTWWTWARVSSQSWWWTGKPGVLHAMGWQRVGHDWATELNWTLSKDFPVAHMVKNLTAVQETWVQSLGWADPLEKGMAIHSSILAWRIPWTEKPGRLQSVRLQRVRQDWALCAKYHYYKFLESLFKKSIIVLKWSGNCNFHNSLSLLPSHLFLQH